MQSAPAGQSDRRGLNQETGPHQVSQVFVLDAYLVFLVAHNFGKLIGLQ